MSTLVLAYGYVRLNRANGQRLEGLRRQIRAYCKREGLTLGLILADTDVSRTELRPGWTALLGRLNSAEADTVVVLLTLDHLSHDPVLQAAMRARIHAAGGRVSLLMAPTLAQQETQPPGIRQ